uniref:ATP synthase complex subunit 8 n=1 Tax=Curculionidae sp. MT-2014 TaxID=1560010 RepID=A0A0A0RVF4_9CUCU|nr:ATP synthase F0 subunit 8 [Curculionidae sp. MT-2014]
MPQMAPINWLSLFILFVFTLIIFIILNYYSFLYKPTSGKKLKTKSQLNWKW